MPGRKSSLQNLDEGFVGLAADDEIDERKSFERGHIDDRRLRTAQDDAGFRIRPLEQLRHADGERIGTADGAQADDVEAGGDRGHRVLAEIASGARAAFRKIAVIKPIQIDDDRGCELLAEYGGERQDSERRMFGDLADLLVAGIVAKVSDRGSADQADAHQSFSLVAAGRNSALAAGDDGCGLRFRVVFGPRDHFVIDEGFQAGDLFRCGSDRTEVDHDLDFLRCRPFGWFLFGCHRRLRSRNYTRSPTSPQERTARSAKIGGRAG
jgi:hypothetical protein